MNFWTFVSLLICAASIKAISEDILVNRNKCIDFLELDEDYFPKTKEDSTSAEVEAYFTFDPNDYESLALWKCILKREKVISPSGQYQIDAFKKWLPEDTDFSEIEKCMTIKNEDPCDGAHMIHKCVVEQMLTAEEEEDSKNK